MTKTKNKVASLSNEAATTLEENNTKTILGDAYITKSDSKGTESLVQAQTLITQINGKIVMTDNIVTLIDDIWNNDLLTDSGTYKTNGKGYFYWEVDKTDIENDDITVKEKINCPAPLEKYYDQLVDGKFSGDYATYWKTKIETARSNYEKEAAILKKEVILNPGPDYNLVDGTHVTQEKKTVVRDNPLNELGNLLSELF